MHRIVSSGQVIRAPSTCSMHACQFSIRRPRIKRKSYNRQPPRGVDWTIDGRRRVEVFGAGIDQFVMLLRGLIDK